MLHFSGVTVSSRWSCSFISQTFSSPSHRSASFKDTLLNDIRKAREKYQGEELAKELSRIKLRMDNTEVLTQDIVINLLFSYRDIQVWKWPSSEQNASHHLMDTFRIHPFIIVYWTCCIIKPFLRHLNIRNNMASLFCVWLTGLRCYGETGGDSGDAADLWSGHPAHDPVSLRFRPQQVHNSWTETCSLPDIRAVELAPHL